MKVHDSGWNCPGDDVVRLIRRRLERDNRWTCVGPRLRLLNSHWRDAVDNSGYLLCTRRLNERTKHEEAADILRDKIVTALHAYPQYGHLFKLNKLKQLTHLGAVKELKLKTIDNGDDALLEIASEVGDLLFSLELDRVRLSEESFKTMAKIKALKNLTLRSVSDPNFGSLDYQHLKQLTTLTGLSIMYCDKCADLQFLKNLSGLKSFTFETNENQVENLSCICNLPSLTALSLMVDNVSEEDLARFVFPERLKILRLDRRHAGAISTEPIKGLERLGFQSRMTNNLIASLENNWIGSPVDIYPWNLRHIGLGAWNLQIGQDDASYIHTLVAVDLSNLTIAPSVLRFLAMAKRLKELRLHMTLIAEMPFADANVQEMAPLNFSSLEQLTLNPSRLLIDLLEEMTMPLLEYVGIWFDDGVLDFVLDALKHLPSFREVSFAVNKAVRQDSFWDDLRHALSTRSHLKHIGWRQYGSKESQIPTLLVESFEPVGVLVDNDATVFVQ